MEPFVSTGDVVAIECKYTATDPYVLGLIQRIEVFYFIFYFHVY